ncbi:MAG: glycine zipper 2TM domain-containing protein [Synoicihabitans sp.]
MNTKSLPPLAGVAVLLVFGTGCTMPSSEPLIPQAQVGVAATLKQGTVVSVQPVKIEGNKTNLGTMSGAAIGGAGATGGRYDTTGIIAGAVGAAAGAIVGQAVEEVATREDGQRIMLRMDNGDMIEVVQSAEDGYFQEGDRVDVAVGAGNTRVSLSLGIDRTVSGEPAWYEKSGESANYYAARSGSGT